jgi:hypothetical protein
MLNLIDVKAILIVQLAHDFQMITPTWKVKSENRRQSMRSGQPKNGPILLLLGAMDA